MNLTRRRAVGALLAAGLLPFAGCEKQGPLENAGEKADDVIEDAGDAVEDAGDKVEDATDSVRKGGS
ncbi:MAG: hypothetical protein IPJ41_16310 [Phycisphaerales bacterium]|nr:hypothetical protein [Phycisphaerales bacterium]